MPNKFENATSFFRLGLPSTLIGMNPDKFPTDEGTLLKRSQEWNNLKTPASRFTVDGEHFETADVTIILCDFSGSVAFSSFDQISVDRQLFTRFWPKPVKKRSVFQFIRISVAENILCGVFKFIRLCVDGA